ncbi:MAG: putative metal-binding motif-containing protein [Deltaproteobacteria bacterium]|nr:putative metal-binding motif-containing protein [Deltaproteobacteria bacterium]
MTNANLRTELRFLFVLVGGFAAASAACATSGVGDDDDIVRPDGVGEVGADGDADADADADAVDDGAGEGADDGGESTGDTLDEGDACTLADFGARCTVHADCCPGLVCFSPLDDSRPSICTRWCTADDCPVGYGCQVFDDGSGGEAEVCWYPAETMCDACDENADCGEARDLCLGMPGPTDPTFCSIYCEPTDPEGCPDGFTCTAITTEELPTYQCMPDDGVCCVDRDGDDYGQGGGCLGTDCNDGNAAIHPDAPEVCDGIDNDCDAGVDNGPNACGLCRRCVSGSCQDVPAGSDPYEECGGVNCDPWYWGWGSGASTCFHMGSVPATLAACDGAAACRTAEAECTLNHLMGTEQVTCGGTIGVCQLAEGCTGSEPGRCVNQDLGTEDCGVGECTRSVQRCVGGLEQTCTPGSPRTETCNDLDDDCDGATDVAASFATHPHEPNGSCSALTDLGSATAPVTGLSVSGSPTIYPDGDQDFFTILLQEPTDAFWDCIPVICEERYTVTITLTRPPDGAAYQLCASASSCGAQTCSTGPSVVLNWSGTCGGTDDRQIWLSVRSPGGGQFDCHAYDVRVRFDAVLVDTPMWPDCPGV